MAPGTVFVERGSDLNLNKDNFGFGDTAGQYGNENVCASVFLEDNSADCLSEDLSGCAGTCLEFGSAVCVADTEEPAPAPSVVDDTPGGTPSTGDLEGIIVPAYNKKESKSKNLLPIIVASAVSAFVVFGFVCIIMRRRKAKRRRSSVNGNVEDLYQFDEPPGEDDDVEDGGGRFSRFKRKKKKKKNQSADAMDEHDFGGGDEDDSDNGADGGGGGGLFGRFKPKGRKKKKNLSADEMGMVEEHEFVGG